MEKEDIVEITYWSINKLNISIVVCIILFTALFCFAAMMYADKATIKITDLKKKIRGVKV